MVIKAIETVYKGYRFRSRLEARWAVFFDALGIEWEYEKEGYDLGELGWYLPDFEIKLSNGDEWFVEVKGDQNDRDGINKARHLDNHSLNFSGKWGCRLFGALKYTSPGDVLHDMLNVTAFDYNQAINKARQARFEHGEAP